jgi:hypothetical protein
MDQGVTHHGAESWAKAIHKAQAELAAKAKPARRIPKAPLLLPRKRSHNQGPAISETVVPNAKSAMTPAPSIALPVKAATNKAE